MTRLKHVLVTMIAYCFGLKSNMSRNLEMVAVTTSICFILIVLCLGSSGLSIYCFSDPVQLCAINA